MHFSRLDTNREGYCVDYPLSYNSSILRITGGHDQDELIAAHARKSVLASKQFADPFSDAQEKGIAGLVTIGVVYALESVQIKKHDSKLFAFSLCLLNRLFKSILKENAIGKPCQRIM